MPMARPTLAGMTAATALPTPYAPEPRGDVVAEAEAMAETHLAKQSEVERVGQMVRWLDDLVRIPGTKFGIGLDALVGFLLPGVGDAITAGLGLTVVTAAIRRGVPKVVIARMLVNLGVDLLVGAIPVVGDAFDLLWRSNTRNLALLERHQNELEPRPRRSDYAMVALATTIVATVAATPFALLYFLLGAIF